MTALLPTLWSSDNSVPLDVEQAIVAIQSGRRRLVLVILDDVETPHSVGELAEAIAAIELDKDIPDLEPQERKRVYITLVQVHLTTLDRVGAIAYREPTKQVYETDATAGLADLIRHIESVCETGVRDE
jgi:hypothetical protein